MSLSPTLLAPRPDVPAVQSRIREAPLAYSIHRPWRGSYRSRPPRVRAEAFVCLANAPR
ncbi:hypothetical protein FOMPIDRAFT_1023269 [Fomitopsis schrenkii]|uniref:Uncharacterized protein n=1 Tax=Fomitopsis schrenkii TaxID=2126942 RepID=S8FT25_FOMSC|nr:hypothetical protein FOMPIDRAFT_1023269 [Fomitopsis schrenkii]